LWWYLGSSWLVWFVWLTVALVGLMINRGVGGKHRVMPEGRVCLGEGFMIKCGCVWYL